MLSAFTKAVSAFTTDIPSGFPQIKEPSELCIVDCSSPKTSSNIFNNAKPLPGSIFALFDAVDSKGCPCSVFGYPKTCQAGTMFDWRSYCTGRNPIAGQVLRQMKILKHTSMLKFIDGIDVGSGIFIATERVSPLRPALLASLAREDVIRAQQLLADDYAWSLCSILQGLEFVNMKADKLWVSLTPNTVFVTDIGEWRLGLPELLESSEIRPASLFESVNRLPYARDILPILDTQISGMVGIKSRTLSRSTEMDRFAFVALATWVAEAQVIVSQVSRRIITFNPSNEHSLDYWAPSITAKTPQPVVRVLEQILKDSVWKGFDQLQPYFKDNLIVQIQLFLRNIALQDDAAVSDFFGRLPVVMETLPLTVRNRQILTLLTENLGFLNRVSPPIRFNVIFTAAEGLSDSVTYRRLVLTPLLGHFKSPDRLLRYSLLSHSDSFGPHLDATMAAQITDDIARGGGDTTPEVRDVTIRTFLHLIPVVNSTKRQGILQLLSKTAISDPEVYIRQNALVCLCKSFTQVPYAQRIKLILPPLLQGLQDASPQIRAYSIEAVAHLIDHIHPRDLLGKVVVALAHLTLTMENLAVEERSAMLEEQIYPAMELCITRSKEFFIEGRLDHFDTKAAEGESSSSYIYDIDKHAVKFGSWMSNIFSSASGGASPSKETLKMPQGNATSLSNLQLQQPPVSTKTPHSDTTPVLSQIHQSVPQPTTQPIHQPITQPPKPAPPLMRWDSTDSHRTRLTSDPFAQIATPSPINDPMQNIHAAGFDDLLDSLEDFCDVTEEMSAPDSPRYVPSSSIPTINTKPPGSSIPILVPTAKGLGVRPNSRRPSTLHRGPISAPPPKPSEPKKPAVTGDQFWAEFESDDSED